MTKKRETGVNKHTNSPHIELKKRKRQVTFSNTAHLKALQSLDKKLNAAFRQGLNVDVQGLFREAPSDHMPISIKFSDNNEKINMASWNMLADVHLGNYYRNVKIFEILENDASIPKENAFKQRGHWLLSYIAQALLKQGNEIIIQESELEQLIEQIDLSKERSPAKAKDDARRIMQHYTNPDSPHREEFIQSIIHSVEIEYAKTHGYLKWEHRFDLIKNNKILISQLGKKDILSFQECTNPNDMLQLLRTTTGKNYKMIQHKVSERTNDHCVIIYDADKFDIAKNINGENEVLKFGLNNNTKPCMLARFFPKNDNELKPFIVGSIHHPGGKENDIKEILAQVEKLNPDKSQNDNVFILGDYNHEQHFFKEALPENFNMIMPSKGTMAGPDFGSKNKAIDGILTNMENQTRVSTIPMQQAARVELPIKIEFIPAENKRPCI